LPASACRCAVIYRFEEYLDVLDQHLNGAPGKSQERAIVL